jgi:hypothetical protein
VRGEDPIGEDLGEEDLQIFSSKSRQEHFYVQNCIFDIYTSKVTGNNPSLSLSKRRYELEEHKP